MHAQLALLTILLAASDDPSSPAFAGRRGVTRYVSKLGDNSDGTTWAKGFHTIQAALDAVPDAGGGHIIAIRPDAYVEANLWTPHPGAAGAYNLIAGDVDGSLGSGASGWVVMHTVSSSEAVRTVSPALAVTVAVLVEHPSHGVG